MHPAVRLMAAGAVLAALAPACAEGDEPPEPAEAPQEDKAVIAQGCPANKAFGGWRIQSVDVRTPLAFLPWIAADLKQARELAQDLVGQPYDANRISEVQGQIGNLPFARLDREARVGGRVLAVVVTCQPGKALDLTFHVHAVKASLSIATTWEARQRELAAPEQQAGQEALRNGLRLQPRAGYQAGEGLGAGAAALYKRVDAGADAYWRTLSVDGYVSDRLRDLSLAAEGWHDPKNGTWAHLSWRLGYADQSAPAKAVSRLGQSGLQAQLLAQTRPLGAWSLPLRLGAALDAGEHRSGGQDNPAAGLTANQHTQSLKLMAGTTARLDRQSLAASYAVEFGAGNGGAGSLDWVKQIVDIAHQGRWRVGDHRFLSVDTRLSFGQLSERGIVPHSARFYAGGREQRFIGGEEWQIRAAPLLRSLGTNALANVAASPGYQRFAAFNLTASAPVYNVPLVPKELYDSPDQIEDLLQGQLNSAASSLANDMRPDLPSFRQAIALLPQVQQSLAALDSVVVAAQPPAGAAAGAAFTTCQAQVAKAQSAAGKVLERTGSAQVGYFRMLLPTGTNLLVKAVAACADVFNATAHSPQIAQLGAALRASADQLAAWFVADADLAKAAADREIQPVRRIVHTLFNEMNMVAVSPLLLLDVVTLGPRPAGAPRTRIGLGTGLRATLVDSVDFSLGYMVNLRRQAGEARGAFFLTMEFKDPF